MLHVIKGNARKLDTQPYVKINIYFKTGKTILRSEAIDLDREREKGEIFSMGLKIYAKTLTTCRCIKLKTKLTYNFCVHRNTYFACYHAILF